MSFGAGVRELGPQMRRKREALLFAVKQGDLSVYQVLLDRPVCVLEMPVHRLMSAAPGIGVGRMIALGAEAGEAGVNLFKPVVALSGRERAWVASKCS